MKKENTLRMRAMIKDDPNRNTIEKRMKIEFRMIPESKAFDLNSESWGLSVFSFEMHNRIRPVK